MAKYSPVEWHPDTLTTNLLCLVEELFLVWHMMCRLNTGTPLIRPSIFETTSMQQAKEELLHHGDEKFVQLLSLTSGTIDTWDESRRSRLRQDKDKQ
jgi:hypothetical protein